MLEAVDYSHTTALVNAWRALLATYTPIIAESPLQAAAAREAATPTRAQPPSWERISRGLAQATVRARSI